MDAGDSSGKIQWTQQSAWSALSGYSEHWEAEEATGGSQMCSRACI